MPQREEETSTPALLHGHVRTPRDTLSGPATEEATCPQKETEKLCPHLEDAVAPQGSLANPRARATF